MICNSWFVTVEGIDGSGKSTIARYIHNKVKETIDKSKILLTQEPGSTITGKTIRRMLLNPNLEMEAETELLLIFASRAQHLRTVIEPMLRKDSSWVTCDRFTDSTYAYQGGGRCANRTHITELENMVQGDVRPCHVFILDVPPEVGLERIAKKRKFDRIEQEGVSFLGRAREVYLDRADENYKHYTVIDATKPLETVKIEVDEILDKIMCGRIRNPPYLLNI